MALTWYIMFDWDGSGAFATNEAARVTALTVERGRNGPFRDFSVGKCVLTLENNDRRFDPWYTSSPLYPNVTPKRRCRIQVVASTEWSGATPSFEIITSGSDVLAWSSTAGDMVIWGLGWDVFYGAIEDVEPMGKLGNRAVTITLYDGLRDLREASAPEIMLTRNQPAGVLLGYLLDAVGWPTGGARYLEAGDTVPYFWSEGERKASELALELAASEQGALVVSAGGWLRFLSRATYWADDPGTSLDQAKFTDLGVASPWSLVYNKIRLRCAPSDLTGALTTIWTLRDKAVYLAPGETVAFAAQFSDANGKRAAASGVVEPVAYTDYTAGTLPASEGGGFNMTDYCILTTTIYATEALLSIRNAHATNGMYLLTCQLRGYPLSQDLVTFQADDLTSQATYGVRTLDINAPWRQSAQSGAALADALVAMYADPQPLVDAELDNVFPDLVTLDLCDQLTLTAALYSINGTFRVGAVSLRTGASMQDLKGAIRLEPV